MKTAYQRAIERFCGVSPDEFPRTPDGRILVDRDTEGRFFHWPVVVVDATLRRCTVVGSIEAFGDATIAWNLCGPLADCIAYYKRLGRPGAP